MLASIDHFADGERVIMAQVPTKGVTTLYPIIGDLFGLTGIDRICDSYDKGYCARAQEQGCRGRGGGGSSSGTLAL
jgi:hypothetical protein